MFGPSLVLIFIFINVSVLGLFLLYKIRSAGTQ